MGIAVIAYNMPLIDHPLDQIRIFADIVIGDKKDGATVFLLEDIENLGGIAVFISFVKG